MRKKILNIVYFIGTLTFFGLFYPEFVFLPDTCVYVAEDGKKIKGSEEAKNISWEEMSEDIVVESRVFNFFKGAFQVEETDVCQQKQKQLECLIREWED